MQIMCQRAAQSHSHTQTHTHPHTQQPVVLWQLLLLFLLVLLSLIAHSLSATPHGVYAIKMRATLPKLALSRVSEVSFYLSKGCIYLQHALLSALHFYLGVKTQKKVIDLDHFCCVAIFAKLEIDRKMKIFIINLLDYKLINLV